MFGLENLSIFHIIIFITVCYIALNLRSDNEKNLTLVYLDNNGHVENIDPPYEINIKKDKVEVETGYQVDNCFCRQDMIFLLLKPTKSINIPKMLNVRLSPWNSYLRVKIC